MVLFTEIGAESSKRGCSPSSCALVRVSDAVTFRLATEASLSDNYAVMVLHELFAAELRAPPAR